MEGPGTYVPYPKARDYVTFLSFKNDLFYLLMCNIVPNHVLSNIYKRLQAKNRHWNKEIGLQLEADYKEKFRNVYVNSQKTYISHAIMFNIYFVLQRIPSLWQSERALYLYSCNLQEGKKIKANDKKSKAPKFFFLQEGYSFKNKKAKAY